MMPVRRCRYCQLESCTCCHEDYEWIETVGEQIAELQSRLSAAEKDRDEAIAYAETLRNRIEPLIKILRDWEPGHSSGEERRAIVLAKDAWRSTQSAALSHLRQEIRRGAFKEVLTEWEKPW